MEPVQKTLWKSALHPIITALPTATALAASSGPISPQNDKDKINNNTSNIPTMDPRLKSMLYMGGAMSLHFGGYEFCRNACLALFTSSEYGFSSATAYPLANGLVSPFSLLLLWYYSQQLFHSGPRGALRRTTLLSIAVVLVSSASLGLCHSSHLPRYVGQAIIWLTFLFQNSYQYLLYTQHWSFAGSVLTPAEGARWFPALAGFSSVVCSVTSSLVPYILPYSGILGLMALTSLTLTGSLLLGDYAYFLSEKHNFDPAPQIKEQQRSKDATGAAEQKGRLSTAIHLFRRVPTLSVLFLEAITFQSLNTILNVAFVRTLKQQVPQDVARAAYSGRFYGLVNAVSAFLQLVILPVCMKFTEPAWIWIIMPLVPLAFCTLQVSASESSLLLVAGAVFLCKTMDYSMRSVIVPMVYQPLDFESRFMGKEIIGVFGSRFGKSGMSLILSGLTSLGLLQNMAHLSVMSLVAAGGWSASTIVLSRLIPRKAQAQAMVEERLQRDKKSM